MMDSKPGSLGRDLPHCRSQPENIQGHGPESRLQYGLVVMGKQSLLLGLSGLSDREKVDFVDAQVEPKALFWIFSDFHVSLKSMCGVKIIKSFPVYPGIGLRALFENKNTHKNQIRAAIRNTVLSVMRMHSIPVGFIHNKLGLSSAIYCKTITFQHFFIEQNNISDSAA